MTIWKRLRKSADKFLCQPVRQLERRHAGKTNVCVCKVVDSSGAGAFWVKVTHYVVLYKQMDLLWNKAVDVLPLLPWTLCALSANNCYSNKQDIDFRWMLPEVCRSVVSNVPWEVSCAVGNDSLTINWSEKKYSAFATNILSMWQWAAEQLFLWRQMAIKTTRLKERPLYIFLQLLQVYSISVCVQLNGLRLRPVYILRMFNLDDHYIDIMMTMTLYTPFGIFLFRGASWDFFLSNLI